MVISILKNNQGIRLVLDFTKKNDFIIREKLKIKIEIEEEWEAFEKNYISTFDLGILSNFLFGLFTSEIKREERREASTCFSPKL
jgi:hypothetical protein